MELNKISEYLNKNKWIAYIPLTIAVVLLISLADTCFAPLLAALVTLGIPYLFGERSIKTFLKTGTVIILITGILLGAVTTYFLYNQTYLYEHKALGNEFLSDGTVEPYLGNETTSFNYTVRYTGTEPQTNITIYANISGLSQEFKKSIPLKNYGPLYFNETMLDKNVYAYWFEVYFHDNNTYVKTKNFNYGPITVPFEDMVWVQIFWGIVSMFLGAGLMFYIIVGMYYWSRKSKEQRMKWEEQMKTEAEALEKEEAEAKKEPEEEEEIEKGEYECDVCGAIVDADADRCWKCGEIFEDEEEDKDLEPKVK